MKSTQKHVFFYFLIFLILNFVSSRVINEIEVPYVIPTKMDFRLVEINAWNDPNSGYEYILSKTSNLVLNITVPSNVTAFKSYIMASYNAYPNQFCDIQLQATFRDQTNDILDYQTVLVNPATNGNVDAIPIVPGTKNLTVSLYHRDIAASTPTNFQCDVWYHFDFLSTNQ